jgi:hypothetical protein
LAQGKTDDYGAFNLNVPIEALAPDLIVQAKQFNARLLQGQSKKLLLGSEMQDDGGAEHMPDFEPGKRNNETIANCAFNLLF